MCEIQFMKKLKGSLSKDDFNSFCELMELGSYYNSHAWGMFNNDLTIKASGSFVDYEDRKGLYKQVGKNQNFVVGHNRFATKGDCKDDKNNHPFESTDFLLVHNGVISNDNEMKNTKELFYKGETDSIVILEYIQALKNLGKSTVQAIKKTAELLKGSFSVFLYEKATDELYYFKNSKTNFTFGYVERGEDKLLVGSTNSHNFAYLYRVDEQIFHYMDCNKFLTKEATAGTIYRITNKIEPIATFKEAEVTSYYPITTTCSNGLITIGDMARDVYQALKNEGITVSYRVNYTDREAYFSPVKPLTEEEETSIYTILANLCFFDEEKNWFVMDESDLENFCEQYGEKDDYMGYKLYDEDVRYD